MFFPELSPAFNYVQGLVMSASKWRGKPYTDPLAKMLVIKIVNYFTLSKYSTFQSKLFILEFSKVPPLASFARLSWAVDCWRSTGDRNTGPTYRGWEVVGPEPGIDMFCQRKSSQLRFSVLWKSCRCHFVYLTCDTWYFHYINKLSSAADSLFSTLILNKKVSNVKSTFVNIKVKIL